jgi:hypothetical protein
MNPPREDARAGQPRPSGPASPRQPARQDREGDREQYRERPKGPLLRECSPDYNYRRRSGQVAIVLLYNNGGHSVVWPERREHHQPPWHRKPFTVFEVLLGRNVAEFALKLPAAGDGVLFDASAKVHWEVVNPYQVVTQRVWDIAELLHDELLDGLRAVSRRFGLTDAQRADEAVREELAAGRLMLGRDLGLRTRVHVFIDLSKVIQRQVEQRHKVGLAMATDEAKAEAELRKERNRQRLLAERAGLLEKMLRRGEEAEIAHHMAQNPEKQWEIRQAIRREKREGQADFLALFNRLVDAGVLERHDIGEQMYEVLQFLRENTGGVIGGVAERVLPGSPERRLALEAERGRTLPEPERPPWEEPRSDGTPQLSGGEESRDDRPQPYRGETPRGGTAGDEVSRDGTPHVYGEVRHVYEPTQVESATEAAERRSGELRRAPSDAFDDWDDE